MTKRAPLFCFFLTCVFAGQEVCSQTFSWASYVRATHRPIGSTYYSQTITTGTTSTTVYADIQSFGNAAGAVNNSVFASSSPLYRTSDAVGGCGTSNSFQSGIALYMDWSDYGTAASHASTQWPYVLVTVDFTGGTNGVCGPVTFSIYDINSDGSFQTFLDWVEVSAYSSTGAYIVPSISAGTQKCNYNMGTYTNPASPGPLKYNGSSSCNCWPDYITIGNGTTVIGKILIKYYPDHSGSYWNTSPRNPSSQYIIISNMTTGGVGCAAIVLPVEFTSFKGECENGKKHFSWTTASEENNDHFVLQQSDDGENFEDILQVPGNGTTQTEHKYDVTIPDHDHSYYRIKQVDRNGDTKFSGVRFVSCNKRSLLDVSIYPNPSAGDNKLEFNSLTDGNIMLSITDITGKEVWVQEKKVENGLNSLGLETSVLKPGIYYLKIHDPANFLNTQTLKLIRQ